MALFGKGKDANTATTVSDENTAMLPDDKKSQSDVITKRTNAILVFLGVAMIAVLAVSAFIATNKKNSDITAVEKELSIKDEKNKLQEIEFIPTTLTFNPEDVKLDNVTVNDDTMQQLVMTVFQNPIKVTDVSVSLDVAGLNVDKSDCLDKTQINAGTSCFINISWTPESKETKNLFLVIKYNDLDEAGNVRGSEKTERVSMNLQSVVPNSQPAPQDTGFDSKAFEDEIDDAIDDEEEEEEPEDVQPEQRSASTMDGQQNAPTRVVTPDNCKKYASKAYDFSGTFIGWVQGNNTVYAPNCSKIIGTMQDDGMVMETGTGKIIGKGVILDKAKSEEKRIELELPMLEEVMQTITQRPQEPDYEEVLANRRTIKEQGTQEEAEDGTWKYQITDTLGIGKAQKKKLIPLGIQEQSQISSLPKDERYVLRQSKPIPAVLNRPVYFSTDVMVDQPVTATVERNVFGGKGRTVIIPAGSQIIGMAKAPSEIGILPVQKIGISWNRLIRPDGAEFNFGSVGNYSADAQGRAGVAGRNDTEYMQQLFVKPLLYSILPVAMEAIFPTTSALVTRVQRSDGQYQTVAQAAGQNLRDNTTNDYSYMWNNTQTMLDMTSKDKIKAEVQQNFKSVMQKLVEDSSKQKIPFTIPSGTRIQIFLDKDVMLRIADDMNEVLEDDSEERNEDARFSYDETSRGDGDNKFGDSFGTGAGEDLEETQRTRATTLSQEAGFTTTNTENMEAVVPTTETGDEGGDEEEGEEEEEEE